VYRAQVLGCRFLIFCSLILSASLNANSKPTLACFGQERSKIEVNPKQLVASEYQWRGSCYSHPPSLLTSAVIYRRTGQLQSFSEEHVAYCGTLGCDDLVRQLCNKGFFISGYTDKIQDEMLKMGHVYTEDPQFESKMRSFLESSSEVLGEDEATYKKLLAELGTLQTPTTKEKELARYKMQREINAIAHYKAHLEKQSADVLNSKDAAKLAQHQQEISNLKDELFALRAKIQEYTVGQSPEMLQKRAEIVNEIEKLVAKHDVIKKLKERSDAFLADHEERKVKINSLQMIPLPVHNSPKANEKPQFVGRLSCRPEENEFILRLIEKALCLDFPVSINFEAMGVAKFKKITRSRVPERWTENSSFGVHAMLGKSLEYIDGKLHLVLQNSYGTGSLASIEYENFCAITKGHLLLDQFQKDGQDSEVAIWEKHNLPTAAPALVLTSSSAEAEPANLQQVQHKLDSDRSRP